MDNLKEMDKFLETCNLSRLNHGETENLNKFISGKEIESVFKNLPQNISPGQDSFTGEFYQTKELVTFLLKFFQTIQEV